MDTRTNEEVVLTRKSLQCKYTDQRLSVLFYWVHNKAQRFKNRILIISVRARESAQNLALIFWICLTLRRSSFLLFPHPKYLLRGEGSTLLNVVPPQSCLIDLSHSLEATGGCEHKTAAIWRRSWSSRTVPVPTHTHSHAIHLKWDVNRDGTGSWAQVGVLPVGMYIKLFAHHHQRCCSRKQERQSLASHAFMTSIPTVLMSWQPSWWAATGWWNKQYMVLKSTRPSWVKEWPV